MVPRKVEPGRVRGAKHAGSSGFTLVEVLVAILILGLVVSTALAVFVGRTRRLQQASESVLVYQALANEAEVRRRIDFSALPGASITFISDTALLGALPQPTTHVTVTDVSPTLRKVAMKVTWRGGEQNAELTITRADTGGSNLW